jgi:hypothetical protein
MNSQTALDRLLVRYFNKWTFEQPKVSLIYSCWRCESASLLSKWQTYCDCQGQCKCAVRLLGILRAWKCMFRMKIAREIACFFWCLQFCFTFFLNFSSENDGWGIIGYFWENNQLKILCALISCSTWPSPICAFSPSSITSVNVCSLPRAMKWNLLSIPLVLALD